MKKILLIVLAVVVAAGLLAFFVYKQQSGYTKVITGKVVRQELSTVVSGTGQIKPKTYANLGATAMGRVTHLYVKEGDTVTKGQTVATIENVQQQSSVSGQEAAIGAAKTDIASYVAAEKTAEANVERRPRPIWSRSGWTGSGRRACSRPALWPSRTTTPRKPPLTQTWPPWRRLWRS